MAFSFRVTVSFAVTLGAGCLLSLPPLICASRDTDVTVVEVSRTHFVAQKESGQNGASSHGMLSEIRDHREPGAAGVTPEMRQQITAFSKLAVQALANGDNPDMSHEEKAKNVQAALAQATNAMASLASHADIEKNPVLAQKLSNLQALTAPSLIQKHQRAKPGSISTLTNAKITPEMHDKVVAFGKAAVQALADGRDPDMSHQDKAKTIHRALARAANALLSITSLADMTNRPELVQRLAGLKELSAPSLIQERQDHGFSSSGMTSEMRHQVAAFSKAAVQALANGNNADMSLEEQAEHVQAALSKATNVMESMASLADKSKAPELAEKVAHLKELTPPGLIIKRFK